MPRNERKPSSRDRSRSRSRSPDRHGYPSSHYQTNISSSTSSNKKTSKSSSSRHDDRERDRQRMEETRRERMNRLRAENEEEEKKMTALDRLATQKHQGLDTSAIGNETNVLDTKEKNGKTGFIELEQTEFEDMEEEDVMTKLLGFSGDFGSTKGKAVEDNKKTAARGAVSKNKARKYRQYMNRKGGFNRPLDKLN